LDVKIVLTTRRGEAKELSETAKQNGFDTILVAGGDGTINEVLNGIIGQDLALGILPTGTGNLIARKLKIPFDLKEAFLNISKGRTTTLDVGEIVDKEHFFLIEAGLGLEADIAKEELITKKKLFHLPLHFDYTLKILKHIYKFNKRKIEMYIDEKYMETDFLNLACSNLSYVDIDHLLNLNIDPTDSKLDVIITNPDTKFGAVLNLLRLKFHQEFRAKNYFKAKKIHIKSVGLLLQADGEIIDKTPATIELSKFKQKIIVPN